MSREKTFNVEKALVDIMMLFWKKGYHATSMDDIVRELKINRSSIYGTFGGKKEIFVKAIKNYQEQSLDRTREVFRCSKNVRDGFRNLFEGACNSLGKDKEKKGCLMVNSSTELIPGDGEFKKFLQKHKEMIEKEFEWQILRGMEIGELSPSLDPKATASFLFILYNGIGVVSKLDSNNWNPRFLVDQIDKILS